MNFSHGRPISNEQAATPKSATREAAPEGAAEKAVQPTGLMAKSAEAFKKAFDWMTA